MTKVGSVFANGVSLGINQISGQNPCPGVDGQHKINSVIFFCSDCIVLSFFCLHGLLSICFDFCFSGVFFFVCFLLLLFFCFVS